jgi:Ca2+-transporting ATPase
MLQPPRKRGLSLFGQDELLISIVQGLLITTGVLWLYYFSMYLGDTIDTTRTIVFSTLILSNIFLTFTNRSFTENFKRTIQYKNNLAPWIILISAAFLAVILLAPPIREIFGLAPISLTRLLLCTGVAFISVAWFEIYKTHPYQPGKPLVRSKHY